MDRFYRYLNQLKNARFGLNLPKGALLNYAKFRLGMLDPVLGNGKTYPLFISIMVTHRCNLQCSFCIVRKATLFSADDWKNKELTVERCEKILSLDVAKKAIGIVFTGGEPLLNRNMPELIRMCRERKYLVGIITNGTYLENCANDLIKAGLCEIQLSIYDNTKDKLACILPKITSCRYLPIHASYVLLKSKLVESSKNNFADLIDTITMCQESGCSSFKINLCQPSHNGSAISELITTDDLCYYDAFIDACKEKLKNACFSGYGSKPRFFPSGKFDIWFPFPVVLASKQERCCRVPFNYLFIDADGDVSICCTVMQTGGWNIFRDGENVLNSEEFLKVRRPLINPSLELENICVNCIFNFKSFSSQM
jgi:MoaA/NifB/PqqE/SkfB family radical SAM enzyme